jgi:hypothetical protein
LEDLRRFSDLGLDIFALGVVVKSLLERNEDASWAAKVVAYAS